jgi:muconolactone delta-isomerase
MGQKSILEQALLQIENLEDAMKQNSKGILASTMKEEFKNLLEQKEKEEEGINEQPSTEEDDVPEDGDDETMTEPEDDSSDDTDDSDEPMNPDDEEDDMDTPSSMDDTSEPSDDTLDMTGASDDEVLRVFKAMKPEDGIVVKKDGNNLEIDVNGEEYIIKLDELDDDMTEEDMNEEDMTEEDMTEEEMSEEEMTEDDMTEEDETIYEIELDEEASEEETKESKVKKTEPTEAARTKWNVHGDKNESNRAGLKSKKMFKAGSGQINEDTSTKTIDGVKVRKIDGKLEYHVPSNMDGDKLKKWKEKNKEVLDAFKKSDTVKESQVNEETSTKTIDGVKVSKVNGKVELHIPSTMDGDRLKRWKEKNKEAIESFKKSDTIKESFENLKRQNGEYKKALVLFKDKLNEVAVFNANLAYATRLFTEHSTTKQEKLNILKRFDSISTMNESKSLYHTIKSELEVKKPVTETVVDKITSTTKTSSSKPVLAESKAYENPQFKRMKDLMNKIK